MWHACTTVQRGLLPGGLEPAPTLGPLGLALCSDSDPTRGAGGGWSRSAQDQDPGGRAGAGPGAAPRGAGPGAGEARPEYRVPFPLNQTPQLKPYRVQ
eukprot:scaffold6616_cov64-Phaeocystis_antarctica.AAC.3